jgi:exodeoxyribonuclease VII small subunit
MVKPARPSHPASFEAALAELETIVRAMEEGQLALEESLTTYERGTSLLKYCQERLNAADQKLKTLEGVTSSHEVAPAEKPESPLL